ncbi:MAG: hypothetical protein ACKOAM_05880 [Chakrabartia sp.]
MYSEADLQSAVEAGALSPEAAEAFRAHVGALNASPIVDEEQFRLLTGFNDIFVSIAAVLFLVGCAWAGGSVAPWLGAALVAMSAWGMAEYFTAKRRMALPSIILLIAFVGGTFSTALGIVFGKTSITEEDQGGMAMVALAAAVASGAAWIHWRRFKVPITIAAGVAAAVGMLLSLLAATVPDTMRIILPTLLLAGLAIFLLAMRWDLTDRTRATRRSDVAFWLHLLAAPMIVHPIFVTLGLTEGTVSIGLALLVLGIYLLLGAIALIIDRRALMVSALAYVLTAMGTLFREFGAVSLNIALTAIIIGSALLLLSALWHDARLRLIQRLPDDWQSRLPVAGFTPPPAS